MYAVWAFRVGPPMHESISAAAFRGQPTDEPAILITCGTVRDRDRLLASLRDQQPQEAQTMNMTKHADLRCPYDPTQSPKVAGGGLSGKAPCPVCGKMSHVSSAGTLRPHLDARVPKAVVTK